MDGLLSFLCLLCVLITPGHSLSCIKCKGVNSCTGSSQTCLPDYSCGAAYIETTEEATSTTAYILSCVSNTKCNKMGSISYTGGTIKFGISCCDTDNCTPPLPQLPATSSEANGLVCPSCQSWYMCDQKTNIQCTGSEQTCIFQPSLSGSVMGCGTSTLCDVADYSNDFVSIQFYCFPATSSTATGPSCVVCASMSYQTCSSSLTVIPENYKCATSYTITNTNGAKSYQVFRSWAPVNKCNIAGSVTTKNTKYFVGIICCDGDGCTPSISDPTSTTGVSNANGVQCKSCDYSGHSSCEANTYINCTGEETQCVDYAWTTTYGTTNYYNTFNRGCATKSLYDAQNLSSTMNYMTFVNTFVGSGTTSNGGNSITAPSNGGVIFLLFSTLAAILILHQFTKDH
ncbi:uncharacterized protein LOC143933102 [Lithobates pipiens]